MVWCCGGMCGAWVWLKKRGAGGGRKCLLLRWGSRTAPPNTILPNSFPTFPCWAQRTMCRMPASIGTAPGQGGREGCGLYVAIASAVGGGGKVSKSVKKSPTFFGLGCIRRVGAPGGFGGPGHSGLHHPEATVTTAAVPPIVPPISIVMISI